jgi:hypothetical protein
MSPLMTRGQREYAGLTIGLIAQATSLRLALGLLVLTCLAIAGLATRWPGSRPGRAR